MTLQEMITTFNDANRTGYADSLEGRIYRQAMASPTPGNVYNFYEGVINSMLDDVKIDPTQVKFNSEGYTDDFLFCVRMAEAIFYIQHSIPVIVGEEDILTEEFEVPLDFN